MNATLLLKATPSFLRWLVSVPISWIAIVLSMLVCPISCLIVRKDAEGRDWLLPFWQWTTTHDTAVDTWWVAGYRKQANWIHRKFTPEYYASHWWLRYLCRMCWIFRNPAYQTMQYLGFDQKGMKLLYKRDEGKYWDSGYNNFSFWISRNERGQYGFMLQFQHFYWKNRCVELYWGWKLFRTDPDRRCMVAVRITPFFTYDKKTEEELERDWEETRRDRENAEAFWQTGVKDWH